MNGNRIGTLFQVSSWGESHGAALGAVVDGCPAGIALQEDDFLTDMMRRRGAAATYTTPRSEPDRVRIESGVFEGRTTGTPIALRIENADTRSVDYERFRHVPRPGHGDLTSFLKHGHRDHRGGGRLSARETAARVAAAVVAKKLLALQGVEITAWLFAAGPLELPDEERRRIDALPCGELRAARDRSPLGAPSAEAGAWMARLEDLRSKGDSWGGAIRFRADGLQPGLGEPVFDKLAALLAHGMMSLPAAVAFEAGGGARLSVLPGSEIRDPIGVVDGESRPLGNRHGGMLGGLSSGLPLFGLVRFHAPTSIPQKISSVDLRNGSEVELAVGGRHDAFPLPRAVPVVEAMAAIVLADLLLRHSARP